MSEVTSLKKAKELLSKRQFILIDLPVSGITVKCKRPNMIQASINKQLPTFIADLVLDNIKTNMKYGADGEARMKERLDKLEIEDAQISDILQSGRRLICDIAVEPPFSLKDTEKANPDDLEDTDVFAFVNIIVSTMQGGGEGQVSTTDLVEFPEPRKRAKRTKSSEVL